MSTSYNRDAFSDLMEQLRMQGTPMGETNVRGKSSIGTVATPTGVGVLVEVLVELMTSLRTL